MFLNVREVLPRYICPPQLTPVLIHMNIILKTIFHSYNRYNLFFFLILMLITDKGTVKPR